MTHKHSQEKSQETLDTRASARATIAVIGGGAAGLVAAVSAGMRARQEKSEVQILVFESDDRVGRSILATGNGRCNFSNAHIDVKKYKNAAFVKHLYDVLDERFQTKDFRAPIAFFENLGLVWREEREGRLYPLANKASVVLDLLREAGKRLGVVEVCNTKIAALIPPTDSSKPFTLKSEDGVFYRAGAVIVACGGKQSLSFLPSSYPRIEARPVLVSLACKESYVKELNNIRLKAEVSLIPAQGKTPHLTEEGEVMFRAYGLSGIAIFNLSREVQVNDRIVLNLLPGYTQAQVRDLLGERRRAFAQNFGSEPTVFDLLRGLLLPRVSEVFLRSLGINAHEDCSEKNIEKLAAGLVSWTFHVSGIGDKALSQVTRGGINLAVCDGNTLESRQDKGLFFAGEALDIDGPCGGYNLHWAWASGMMAAQGAFESLKHRS
ncbi:MAG: aminoacetone oxidase family FAD-binding enzyme [Eggerthellaceae bacterium]